MWFDRNYLQVIYCPRHSGHKGGVGNFCSYFVPSTFPFGYPGMPSSTEHSYRELISAEISLISVSNVIFTDFISQFSALWYLRDIQPHSFRDNSSGKGRVAARCFWVIPWAQMEHSTFSQIAAGIRAGLARGALLLLVNTTLWEFLWVQCTNNIINNCAMGM